MKSRFRDISFGYILQLFMTLAMIALTAFTIFALSVCLSRDDIEDAIILAGMTMIMVPMIILLIKTKI